MRYVFVLSREHRWRPWLYDYLVRRFEGDTRVEVIVDRRVADRRGEVSGGPVGSERRRAERRRPVPPEDDLRVRSHYIAECEARRARPTERERYRSV